MEEIKRIVTESIAMIINEQFEKAVVEKVVQKVTEENKAAFSEYDNKILMFNRDIEELKTENARLKKAADDQEQHSRAHNVRVFGVPFNKGENLLSSILEIFNSKMKLNITVVDVVRCFRVVARNPPAGDKNNKPPAVLVEFRSVNIRSAVLKQRKLLKSTGLAIQEDLTVRRLSLLKMSADKFGSKNVWSLHGNIYVRNPSGTVRRVEDVDDSNVVNV